MYSNIFLKSHKTVNLIYILCHVCFEVRFLVYYMSFSASDFASSYSSIGPHILHNWYHSAWTYVSLGETSAATCRSSCSAVVSNLLLSSSMSLSCITLCHQQRDTQCESLSTTSGRSLLYITNSKGSSTLPCGMPLVIWALDDYSTLTNDLLLYPIRTNLSNPLFHQLYYIILVYAMVPLKVTIESIYTSSII